MQGILEGTSSEEYDTCSSIAHSDFISVMTLLSVVFLPYFYNTLSQSLPLYPLPRKDNFISAVPASFIKNREEVQNC